jgi:hypothetical protein
MVLEMREVGVAVLLGAKAAVLGGERGVGDARAWAALWVPGRRY